MDFRHNVILAGESEGARRATGDSPAGAPVLAVTDPAVEAKAKRRRFSVAYKLRVLREADRAKGPGEVGAILRREGLYSSHLTMWRRERDRMARKGLAARKRGPKKHVQDPRTKRLERENVKLKKRNRRLETLVEIQKKASELLGIPLNRLDADESD